jgi:hypothetical protein
VPIRTIARTINRSRRACENRRYKLMAKLKAKIKTIIGEKI